MSATSRSWEPRDRKKSISLWSGVSRRPFRAGYVGANAAVRDIGNDSVEMDGAGGLVRAPGPDAFLHAPASTIRPQDAIFFLRGSAGALPRERLGPTGLVFRMNDAPPPIDSGKKEIGRTAGDLFDHGGKIMIQPFSDRVDFRAPETVRYRGHEQPQFRLDFLQLRIGAMLFAHVAGGDQAQSLGLQVEAGNCDVDGDANSFLDRLHEIIFRELKERGFARGSMDVFQSFRAGGKKQ